MTKAKPRILLCTDDLPPSDGGVEQVVQKLAIYLNNEGFSVAVFTLGSEDKTYEVENHGIQVYRSKPIELTDLIGLQSTISPSAFSKFRSVVVEFKPDIVHAHNRFFFTSLVASIYKPFFEYSLITSLHLGRIDMISGISGVTAQVYQKIVSEKILRVSDHIIAVSDAVSEIPKGAGYSNVTVVRNAVDVTDFTPQTEESKSLLFIGRLVKNNGINDLLAAIPTILENHSDASIQIIGQGPLESDVQRFIEENNVSGQVGHTKFIEDISQAYNSASVFCRPSYSEGLPLTLLESMSSGVVPVVTPVAGVPEIVNNGENGLLVPTNDPAVLADNICDLFDDTTKMRCMSINAREYALSNLSWEQRGKNVRRIYQEVM